MDLLEIVQNHLYNEIIKEKSLESIATYSLPNHTYSPSSSPLILSITINGNKYVCKDSSYWIHKCPYIRDSILSMDGDIGKDEEHIISITSTSLSIDPLPILESYLARISSDEKPYKDVTLYTTKPYLYVRETDAEWFRERIVDISMENGYNWDNIEKLLDTIEIANFLGCESFSIYLFLYLYSISVSLSISDRERLLGSPYFMLPIIGWDHPIRHIFSIPFLDQQMIEGCTDDKYKEIGKICKLFQ